MGLKRRQLMSLLGWPAWVSRRFCVWKCWLLAYDWLVVPLFDIIQQLWCPPAPKTVWGENNKKMTERQECKYLDNFNQPGVFQRHSIVQ